MIGPILSQLAAQAWQLAAQAWQFVAQELSKPHNQAHIAKAIGEISKTSKRNSSYCISKIGKEITHII